MLFIPFLQNLLKGIKYRLQLKRNKRLQGFSIGWFQQKYLKHLPAGKIRSIELFGRRFFYEAPQELLHGLQEIFVEGVYRHALSNNPTIIDCGANIGLSVLYFKRQFPAATIIAFEPDPQNYALLQKNIESFQLQDIECNQAAVWVENTKITFAAKKGMASGISIAESENCIEVAAVRLKDYLNQKIDFLKIDIEGAEWEVLKDCASNLKNVQHLFVEYHGTFEEQEKLTAILSLLNQAGFRYYIKEAAPIFTHPFQQKNSTHPYDLQLNVFALRN
jgi:FkbM family methyltransferase